MTTEVFSKRFVIGDYAFGVDLANELWYYANHQGKARVVFGVTIVKLDKYPDAKMINIFFGPLVFRIATIPKEYNK